MCGGELALNYSQVLTSSIEQHPTNKYATNVAYLHLRISRVGLFGNQCAFTVRKYIKTAGLVMDEIRHNVTG
jgi:hypothetical protein